MSAIEDLVVGALIAVAFTGLVIIVGTCEANAQGPRVDAASVAAVGRVPRSTRRELALAVAQVAVNESGWDSPADVALIWQVVEAKRAITDERRVWLTRHSARVLGERECRPRRNCRWTRHLTWSDAEPAEWPPGERWRPERWARVRALAWRLVTGLEAWRPCESAPDTWDGRRWRARNLARGMRLVACTGTMNDGLEWGSAS